MSDDGNNNGPRKKLGQGKKIEKNVFVVFYQGDQLGSRVRKICEGFGRLTVVKTSSLSRYCCRYDASVYPCPENRTERASLLRDVNTRLEDLSAVRVKHKLLKPTLTMDIPGSWT